MLSVCQSLCENERRKMRLKLNVIIVLIPEEEKNSALLSGSVFLSRTEHEETEAPVLHSGKNVSSKNNSLKRWLRAVSDESEQENTEFSK